MARREEFTSQKTVSALLAEELNSFVWIAFEQNDEGNIILQKISVCLVDILLM